MKTCFSPFILSVLLLISVPSAGEILFPAPDDLTYAVFNYSNRGEARAARYLTLREEALASLETMPLGEYAHLEAVMVEFTEDPNAPDEAKERLIAKVEAGLVHLACLKKCPRLKYVILHVGEKLFIRSSEKFPYNYSGPGTVSAAEGINLQRLNARFGKKLEKMLLGITVYAQNWGW